MSEEDLQSLAEEWKKILRVRDWETHVRFTNKDDMASGTAGNNSYRVKLKLATIEVLNPEDTAGDEIPEDPEETLVHELLHLHTAQFDNAATTRLNKFQDLGMEQMVELVAHSLVGLKRERDKAYLEGKRDQLTQTIADLKQAGIK